MVRNKCSLHTMISVVVLMFFFTYFLLTVLNLVRVYGTAYVNSKSILTDDVIVKVVEMESSEDEENTYDILTADNEELSVTDAQTSVMLDDGKDLVYYSKDDNLFILPVTVADVVDMLLQNNILIVLFAMVANMISEFIKSRKVNSPKTLYYFYCMMLSSYVVIILIFLWLFA